MSKMVSMIALVAAFAAIGADGKHASEAELPRIEALAFKSEGSLVYGQVLVPSSKFAGARPCAILCHGFAGFTRWDDVAHDLCRAGIAVVIPHHRGAWGSEGEYTVSGCIRDAENLARWAMEANTAAKYALDTNAVYLVGHSMGGNNVVNAAARVAGVRGVALVAPCDIGFMAQQMAREELKRFLIGEGMLVLKRASDDSIVDDILMNAAQMRFVRAAKALGGKKVFLAMGEYDRTVPNEPLEEFWSELGDGLQKTRRTYRAGHSLMGVRPVFAADLKDFILAAASRNASDSRDGFVALAEAVPDAILEIRYYSTYNFVGGRVDGYEQPCALLSKEAARALKAASDDCIRRGYRLKIYDAYRPQRAVAHFVRWAADVGDTRMKAPFYPNLDKSVLFKRGYIAERSGHSRGSTVDLTLFDMKTGKEVDMGGTFDWFGEESHPGYRGITDAQFKNRMLLREIMVAHGFKPLEEEWWHFTLANEPYPDTYFDFPVRE